MKFKNLYKHFILINKHKYYVFKFCCIAGIPWRGIVHDLSKFSPSEFFESVKYYDGEVSPIVKCKEENGYSLAWLHHKGRNKHHYEYWQDNFDQGGQPLKMPYKYALELVCDYLAAGICYSNQEFSYDGEYNWWVEKRKIAAMNLQTKQFVENMLFTMKKENNCGVLSPHRSYIMYLDACESIKIEGK